MSKEDAEEVFEQNNTHIRPKPSTNYPDLIFPVSSLCSDLTSIIMERLLKGDKALEENQKLNSFSFGGTGLGELRGTEFLAFRPDTSLTKFAMEAYLQVLAKAFKSQDQSILIFGISFVVNFAVRSTPYFQMGGVAESMERNQKVSSATELILFPVYLPGHWVLMTADPKEHIIRIYDSFDGSSDGYVSRPMKQRIAEELAVWLAEELGCESQSFRISRPTVIQQKGTVDCGICVLTTIRLLIAGLPLPSIQDGWTMNTYQDFMAQMRERIASEVVFQRLNPQKWHAVRWWSENKHLIE